MPTEISAATSKKMTLPKFSDKPEDWGSFKKQFRSALRQSNMGLSLILQHAEETFHEADSLSSALECLQQDKILDDKGLAQAYQDWGLTAAPSKLRWDLLTITDCLVLATSAAPHAKTILDDH